MDGKLHVMLRNTDAEAKPYKEMVPRNKYTQSTPGKSERKEESAACLQKERPTPAAPQATVFGILKLQYRRRESFCRLPARARSSRKRLISRPWCRAPRQTRGRRTQRVKASRSRRTKKNKIVKNAASTHLKTH